MVSEEEQEKHEEEVIKRLAAKLAVADGVDSCRQSRGRASSIFTTMRPDERKAS